LRDKFPSHIEFSESLEHSMHDVAERQHIVHLKPKTDLG
jgi:hypothetical protein